MSDTPRTDAAYKTLHTLYELAGEMKRLERELTAAKEHCAHCENEGTDAAADARRSNSLLRECLVVLEEDAPRLTEIEALAQRVRDYLEDEV